EADYGDRAFAAVGDVEVFAVSARVEAVRAGAGVDESDHAQPVAVDLPDAAGCEVGDVEDAAVGRDAHVLGHAAAAVGQVQHADHALAGNIDLDQLAGELAARDQVGAVDGKVHVIDARAGQLDGAVQRKGVRVAEVESVQPLGDDDRVAPVGGEVHVVGVGDRDRPARPAGARIDHRQAVAG